MLLDRLLVRGPDGNTVEKPLALLLTKWDVHGEISDDPAQEEQKALAFLESHPVFQQIAYKLKQAGDRVKVFPVSAFGSHRDGNLPPLDGPKPFNLHLPIAWAVRKVDEMLYESAKRGLVSFAGSGWWKKYGQAIACYTDLVKKTGINKGPVYEQIQAELRPLKKAHFKRRCWEVAALVAIIVGGMRWSEAHRYSTISRLLDDPSVPIQQVDALCQPYVDGWNLFSDWTGHKQAVRKRWTARKRKTARIISLPKNRLT